MRTAEIRRRWLDYFEARDHAVVPSASLVSPDPSTLFTIAGMVPFIPYMLGQQTPPWNRATSVQKCVRTLDIEEVGKTTRHGTFFQMNGNFSFGDYFKEGAIEYAWELVTGSQADGFYGFDPDKVWVTVYHDDDEAARLWRKVAGLPEERIQRRGKKDNYWHTGQPGPAGPCSEIYIDRGPAHGKDGGPVVDEDRFLEIWNLVFMQYAIEDVRSKEDFTITGDLAQKNIDTGMGLERVAYLLQGVDNMYEIDEVFPVIAAAQELSGRRYGADRDDDVRMRVVADHVRSSLMLIGDGITPSNEGRGYVLRRLLRRSVRAMRLLGVDEPALPHLLPVSRDAMSASYPELATDFDRISRAAYAEEEAFRRTLVAGTTILDTAVAQVKTAGGATLGGEQAFALHDTYGFPIDLTLEMAAEQGLAVDEQGFRDLMQAQRERARADAKAKKGGAAGTTVYRELRDQGATEFTGYTELTTPSTIRGLLRDGVAVPAASQGDTVELVLARTPFYAESGGQDSDAGVITADGARLEVLDVQRPVKGLVVHTVRVAEGEVASGAEVLAQVDPEWRRGARQAHSGTHVVHAALREVLGPNALQSGSYNKPGYLRLDFSWNQALSAATRSEVEEVSNKAIREDLGVKWQYMTLPEAKAWGAIALFGETYDEQVRVVEIGGPWSRELCGGTHVDHSSQIGIIALTGEQSVGSGSRRVEAVVGLEAFHHLARERALVTALTDALKVRPEELPERVSGLVARLKDAEKELAGLRQGQLLAAAASVAAGAADVGGVRVVTHEAGAVASADDLRTLALDVRHRLGESPAVVAVGGVAKDRPVVLVTVNPAGRALDLRAGALAKVAAGALGGGGGGKDDVAQGGGTDVTALPAALAAVRGAVAERAGGR
ncbi:alanyl-tRNA synthetase [Actinotalea ferrariae CF5-4]|uniref:Alanine--tRNA ligase n=1 Tax=Actinotalea ferrariae CF5-4 TaxID=948458 RepID=A0A021VNU5_9CELL|nr:alanine--tRNA ligase [Actinotalea ferrariae]EYR62816.1 alanyl-tRNA synthetase [Actinotalea ferrariae CF5-4]